MTQKNKTNEVDKTMKLLGLTTNAELSELCGISTKTIVSWKKKLSPVGKVVLRLLVEKHKLEKEVEDFRLLKKILNIPEKGTVIKK